MKEGFKYTYQVGIIALIFELISLGVVLMLTYVITKVLFYIFIPLPFTLAVIGLINIIINTTEGFYSKEIIFTFETLVVALCITTFAITGLYPWLFLPFFVQLAIVVLIIYYKEFRMKSEQEIDERVELQTPADLKEKATENPQKEIIISEIENLKEQEEKKYYEKNKILSKIKLRGILSVALLSISIYGVWCFTYMNEKTKEEKNLSQYEKLMKNIDSLKISVISLKDSLYKTIKLNEAVIKIKHIKENEPILKKNGRIKTMNNKK